MVAKSKKPGLPTVAAAGGGSAHRAPMSLGFESLADLGRENLAAVTKANLALSQGLGAIGDELFDYAKSAIAKAGQAATALLGAKTFDEVIELNNALAKTAMESLIAQSTKLSELGITTTNQTLAPLGGRFEATVASLRHSTATA